jgi:hypothetical protein
MSSARSRQLWILIVDRAMISFIYGRSRPSRPIPRHPPKSRCCVEEFSAVRQKTVSMHLLDKLLSHRESSVYQPAPKYPIF